MRCDKRLAAPVLLTAITISHILVGVGLAVGFTGKDCQLLVGQITDRCIRIVVAPLGSDMNDMSLGSTVIIPGAADGLLSPIEQPRSKLTIGRLAVSLDHPPLRFLIDDHTGRRVQELVLASDPNGGFTFRTDSVVLGLGEGAKQFDRRGAIYPMEASWGGWDRARLGSVVPSPFLIGTDGWAILVHRPFGQFDLRSNPGVFRPWPGQGPLVDLFVVGLDGPADAVGHYIRLTGRPAMPPRWALGYLQSHRTLAGPEEVLEVASTFRKKGLPCDGLIYLGTGYCPNGWNTGHGSLKFNPKAFDNPKEIIDRLHQMGFKVILHVNRPPRDLFGRSVSEVSDLPSHIGNYWARHREVFRLGIDGFWPDDGDELDIESRLARHRCYYDGPLSDRPGKRPWSLHRTGYAGCQRYGGWIWSGDIDSTWETLSAQIAVGLNHSLSLTPFWGTDTGGFFPTKELTGELYVRWFQFSAFCPLFRSHGRTWHLRLPWGWNRGQFGPVEHNQGPSESELNNPDVEPICSRYLELRYQLLPYNYSMARLASDTGVPMMRPMWFCWPNDPNAGLLSDQYMWGSNLLVAPVVQREARSRRLYLPAGVWYDWWEKRKIEGGRWIERQVDLATMPIYVKAGAIIPLDPVRQYADQKTKGPTRLLIFPGADGRFGLYDDDGASTGYIDGSDKRMFWMDIVWSEQNRTLSLMLNPKTPQTLSGSIRFEIQDIVNGKQVYMEFTGSPMQVEL